MDAQKDINEQTPVEKPDQDTLQAVLEGLIFTAGEDGLSIVQIQSVLKNCSRQEITEQLENIENSCKQQGRGILLTCYGGRYRFLTKDFITPYAKALYARSSMSFLSPSAMETLALVAYNQPITRVEIDEIRGVSSDLMLRKLNARGFVETCGRKDVVGRPLLYQVTARFMDAFGLQSLEDLPEIERPQMQESLFNESEEFSWNESRKS